LIERIIAPDHDDKTGIVAAASTSGTLECAHTGPWISIKNHCVKRSDIDS
jgi:hypothetical protein